MSAEAHAAARTGAFGWAVGEYAHETVPRHSQAEQEAAAAAAEGAGLGAGADVGDAGGSRESAAARKARLTDEVRELRATERANALARSMRLFECFCVDVMVLLRAPLLRQCSVEGSRGVLCECARTVYTDDLRALFHRRQQGIPVLASFSRNS